MWAHTANQFGPVQDQNPRLIGRADKAKRAAPPDGYRAGLEGCEILKSLDPTRLVFTHEGGDVGDVFTVNTYLDFIPLQEREEWLSEWAKTGDMPYIGIEFGTPLYASFLRGRTDYGHAIVSEPFVTEFSAIYLGHEAYKDETPEYRNNFNLRGLKSLQVVF